MSLQYTVRPISDRSWFRPAGARERSRFTASWTDTQELLARELSYLNARNLVLEMDVREQDIRQDGMVRANARPAATDAVVVAFESSKGPLQYRSDIYDSTAWGARGVPPWQHNVRAVAATLEALRAVGRYGASALDEQYRGYKQIGAGGGLQPTGMTTDLAIEIIATEAGYLDGYVRQNLTASVRVAKGNSHPDRRNGDRKRWDAVEQAEQVLKRAGRLT